MSKKKKKSKPAERALAKARARMVEQYLTEFQTACKKWSDYGIVFNIPEVALTPENRRATIYMKIDVTSSPIFTDVAAFFNQIADNSEPFFVVNMKQIEEQPGVAFIAIRGNPASLPAVTNKLIINRLRYDELLYDNLVDTLLDKGK